MIASIMAIHPVDFSTAHPVTSADPAHSNKVLISRTQALSLPLITQIQAQKCGAAHMRPVRLAKKINLEASASGLSRKKESSIQSHRSHGVRQNRLADLRHFAFITGAIAFTLCFSFAIGQAAPLVRVTCMAVLTLLMVLSTTPWRHQHLKQALHGITGHLRVDRPDSGQAFNLDADPTSTASDENHINGTLHWRPANDGGRFLVKPDSGGEAIKLSEELTRLLVEEIGFQIGTMVHKGVITSNINFDAAKYRADIELYSNGNAAYQVTWDEALGLNQAASIQDRVQTNLEKALLLRTSPPDHDVIGFSEDLLLGFFKGLIYDNKWEDREALLSLETAARKIRAAHRNQTPEERAALRALADFPRVLSAEFSWHWIDTILSALRSQRKAWRQRRVLPVALIRQAAKNTYAEELVNSLRLNHLQIEGKAFILEEGGFYRFPVRLPKPNLKAFPQTAATSIYRLLGNTRDIDLIMDRETNRLVAIFPRYARWTRYRPQGAHYLDLSPYYATPLNVLENEREFSNSWNLFEQWHSNTRKRLYAYQSTKRFVLSSINDSEHSYPPYVCLRIDGSMISVDSFRPESWRRVLRGQPFYSIGSLPNVAFDRVLVLPVYWGVYSPSGGENWKHDDAYHHSLYDAAQKLKSGQAIVIVGGGSGIDVVLPALAAPNSPLYATEANPFGVANIRQALKAIGRDGKVRLFDNLMSANGELAFPDVKAGLIASNSPFASVSAKPQAERALHELHDIDDGSFIAQFSVGAPEIADKEATVLFWHWGDIAGPALKEAGLDSTVQETDFAEDDQGSAVLYFARVNESFKPRNKRQRAHLLGQIFDRYFSTDLLRLGISPTPPREVASSL